MSPEKPRTVDATLMLPLDMMNFVMETASRATVERDTVIAAGALCLLEVPAEDLVAHLQNVRKHLDRKGKRLSGPRVDVALPEPLVNRVVALGEETGLDGSTIFAVGLKRLEGLLPERRRGPTLRRRVDAYRKEGWL